MGTYLHYRYFLLYFFHIYISCVALLLFSLFYAASVTYTQIFGEIDDDDIGLLPDLDFSNFYLSFLTTYVITSAGRWALIMESCQRQPPYCSSEDKSCGNPAVYNNVALFYGRLDSSRQIFLRPRTYLWRVIVLMF